MDTVTLVFILVFFVWFPIEFVTGDLLPGICRRGTTIKPMDRGSKLLVYVTIYPALVVAFILAAYIVRQWAVLLLGAFALAYGNRINVEEKVLARELGDEYVWYMKRTKRLIPFIL